MKTQALVADLSRLMTDHAKDPQGSSISQAKKLVVRYKADAQPKFLSRGSQQKLTSEKLDRVAGKIADSVDSSVQSPMRDAFIAECFPELLDGLALADSTRRLHAAKLTEKDIIANAEAAGVDILRRATSQAGAQVESLLDQSSAQVKETLAAAKADLDASKAALSQIKEEIVGNKQELASTVAQLDGINAAWAKVDAKIADRLENAPNQLYFKAGDGQQFLVSKDAIARTPTYLSGLASGHFLERPDASNTVTVTNITSTQLQAVCRYIEVGDVPSLSRENARELRAIADEFSVQGMRDHIDGFLTACTEILPIDQPHCAKEEYILLAAARDMHTARRAMAVFGKLAKQAIAAGGFASCAYSELTSKSGRLLDYSNSGSLDEINFVNSEVQNSFQVAWTIIESRLRQAGYNDPELRFGSCGGYSARATACGVRIDRTTQPDF